MSAPTLADIARECEAITDTPPTPGEVIAAAPTETLLDAVVALTHRIHNLCDLPARHAGSRLAALRAQRDAARAEIVRRAGR